MRSKCVEKLINVTVYVAFDGKEFIDEKSCLDYENTLFEEKDEEAVKSLKSFDYDCPFGEDNFHWAYVTNEEELQSFIRFWLNDDEREYWDYTDPERDTDLRLFPLWIVAIVDDDGNGYVLNAKDVLIQHENFVEAVRKAMKEKDTEAGEKKDDET